VSELRLATRICRRHAQADGAAARAFGGPTIDRAEMATFYGRSAKDHIRKSQAAGASGQFGPGAFHAWAAKNAAETAAHHAIFLFGRNERRPHMRKRILLPIFLLALTIASIAGAAAPVYQRRDLTPGMTLKVTAAEVCRPGYSATVRNVPRSWKQAVFERYGMDTVAHSCCEVDHLISLELGGSNDILNLWPEPYLPQPGAREKDVAENYLHRQVCSGKMTLRDAQRAIVADWYAVYLAASGTQAGARRQGPRLQPPTR
jgi:hypothetical protein